MTEGEQRHAAALRHLEAANQQMQQVAVDVLYAAKVWGRRNAPPSADDDEHGELQALGEQVTYHYLQRLLEQTENLHTMIRNCEARVRDLQQRHAAAAD